MVAGCAIIGSHSAHGKSLITYISDRLRPMTVKYSGVLYNTADLFIVMNGTVFRRNGRFLSRPASSMYGNYNELFCSFLLFPDLRLWEVVTVIIYARLIGDLGVALHLAGCRLCSSTPAEAAAAAAAVRVAAVAPHPSTLEKKNEAC